MVGTRSVHLFAVAPSPKVAAADNDRNFNAQVIAFFYLCGNLVDCRLVKAEPLFTGKSLAAYFNKRLKVPSFNVFSEGLYPITEKIKWNPALIKAGDILI